MRLLECRGTASENFTLTDEIIDEQALPPYAILSHTWGSNSDEVNFKDLSDGTGQDKVGYKKLIFCERQAKQDGLQHFWVDTCCIDKKNSTELYYAINCMFRWYQGAARCYVYLFGFLGTSSDAGFREHRWFSRGWTLQELLAPASVQFFRSDNACLGDKSSLEQQLHVITGIAVPALQGCALAEFSAEERFKWAEMRGTTREEDWVYSLLGIFDVSMPVIYGERRAGALRRLKREIADAAAAAQDNEPLHPVVWMVPFERNPSFFGRELEFTAIRKRLFLGGSTSRVAVTGVGGVGKTHIVLELLYRLKLELTHCSVIWIPATDHESLEQGYLDAAKKLGIPGCEEKNANIKALVRDHLSNKETGRWLLVFDNVDGIGKWIEMPTPQSDRLIDYLPQSNRGSIIFTSRDKKGAVKLVGQNIVEIAEMDKIEGMKVLDRYLGDRSLVIRERDDAAVLLSRLTYLPLAIVQAAMFINSNRVDLKGYLALLEQLQVEEIILLSEGFENQRRYHDGWNPVVITWLVSFQQIRMLDKLAADHLSFMACVDSKDISLLVLPQGPSLQMTGALATLIGYSFVTMQVGEERVTLHRLVRLVTRNWLRKEGLLATWTERVEVRLANLLDDAD